PDVPWTSGGGTGGGTHNGVHTLATGTQALTVPTGASNGTQLTTSALTGGNNQKWTFTAQSDGSYTLANVASGLCADVNAGSMSAGAAIIQWTCTGTTNQRWNITAATGGGHTLTSVKSGLVITTASTGNNALVTQQPASGSALQRWTIG
ncbi:RICIN domain-containing protein, partial [Streptomyces sp. NPDC012693]|uniref:RICIN domain-containing protein n=1 Tax=Streptomyces sp. NPDC012693 TaxID=3364844 RepID=UPI0036CCB05C